MGSAILVPKNCWPMILISGSSEREIVDLMQGDYEEMDQLAIAKPLCKAAFRVLHAEDIGIGIARAIRAAVSGRPGGVYLDREGQDALVHDWFGDGPTASERLLLRRSARPPQSSCLAPASPPATRSWQCELLPWSPSPPGFGPSAH